MINKITKSIMVSAFILVVMMIVFPGCSSDTSGGGTVIISPTWETSDDGWERFITNDEYYYNYGFFKPVSTSDGQGTPEIMIQKVSGASNFGFGIMFAYQTDGSYYKFLINTESWYVVIRVNSDGTVTVIKDWTYDSKISSGYNTVNTIRVDFVPDYDDPDDGTTDTFPAYNIYVDDTFLYGWYNSAGTMLLDGKSGFYASVGGESDESFPDTSVEIYYKMINPVDYP